MSNDKNAEESKSALSLKELPNQVREFWRATGVPIVELTICIVVLSWCAGVGLGDITNRLEAPLCVSPNVQATGISSMASQANAVKEESENKKNEPESILETYGLSAVLPLAALVVLLGIAQGLSTFVRMIGSSLPIHAVYKIDLLLLHYLPVDLLIDAWSRFESVTDVALLSNTLDQEVTRSEGSTDAKRFFERSRELKPVIEQLEGTRRFTAGLVAIGLTILLTTFVIQALKGPWSIESAVHLGLFAFVGSVILIYINLSFLRATRLYHHRKFSDFVAWKTYEKKLLKTPSVEEANEAKISRKNALNRAKSEIDRIDMDYKYGHHVRRYCLVSGTEDLEFDIFSRGNADRGARDRNYEEIKNYLEELER